MRKSTRKIALFIVAAAAITACHKDNINQEQVFTFAIGETKSILGSDEKGRFVQFDSDDQGSGNGIGSIAPNAQGYSSVTPASGDNPATFSIYTKGVEAGNTITVWYPYLSKQTDAAAVELVIPAVQTHKTGNVFNMKAMPMVTKQIVVTDEMVTATGSTNYTPIATINFANLGSLIKFEVFSTSSTYVGEKVKSITFNAKNAAGTEDAYIGGTFTKNLATIDPNNEASMTISSSDYTAGVSSIVTSPVADAAIGSARASALNLYMVVAPGTYTGTIVVKTDAAEYTYPLSVKTLARSGVKAFGLDLNSGNATRVVPPALIYSTAFNYSMNGSSYNSSDIYTATDSGATTSWSIQYGNWNGSSCAQMRVYSAGNFGCLYNNFDCSNVTSVSYKAFVSNTALTLNTYYSTDSGATWIAVDEDKVLTTSSSSYSFTVSATGAYPRVRIKFAPSGTAPSSSNYQLTIDDVEIYGNGSVLADPIITAENITGVPAVGVTDANATYTANYFTDDVEVPSENGFTGCVTDASVTASGTITYTVAPNYTTTAKEGTIVLWSASNHSITKTISVAQLKSTLSVNNTSITIPANAPTATFTVTTAEFGYNAVVASVEDGMNLSISSGATGSASASAQTVTVSSNTEAPTSGDPITLGTISVYRNGNTSDSQKKTITVLKAVNTGTNDPVAVYTANFEGSSEHRTEGNNSYTSNSYTVGGVQWDLTYADIISNNSLEGSYNCTMRSAKKTNNCPTFTTGNVLSSSTTVTKVTFQASFNSNYHQSHTLEYSTDQGTTWNTLSDARDNNVNSSNGYSATFSNVTTSDLRFRFTVTCTNHSSVNSTCDSRIDNFIVYGTN